MEWTVKNFEKNRQKAVKMLLFGLSLYQNWIVRSSKKRSEDKEIKQTKDRTRN